MFQFSFRERIQTTVSDSFIDWLETLVQPDASKRFLSAKTALENWKPIEPVQRLRVNPPRVQINLEKNYQDKRLNISRKLVFPVAIVVSSLTFILLAPHGVEFLQQQLAILGRQNFEGTLLLSLKSKLKDHLIGASVISFILGMYCLHYEILFNRMPSSTALANSLPFFSFSGLLFLAKFLFT